MSMESRNWIKFENSGWTMTVWQESPSKFDECQYLYPESICNKYIRLICNTKINLGFTTKIVLVKSSHELSSGSEKKELEVKAVRVEKIEELNDKEVTKKYAVIFEILNMELDLSDVSIS